MTEQKEAFESVGVCFIGSSGKSLRFEIRDPDRIFLDIYYLSLKDLEDVLKKRKATATLVKLKEQPPEV
jgi:hypothetical protein